MEELKALKSQWHWINQFSSTDSFPYARAVNIFGIAVSLFWLVIGSQIEIDVAAWVPLTYAPNFKTFLHGKSPVIFYPLPFGQWKQLCSSLIQLYKLFCAKGAWWRRRKAGNCFRIISKQSVWKMSARALVMEGVIFRVGQGFWVYGIQELFKLGIRYILAKI